MGVGAWMLHRLGMPMSKVGERQFTLMFLNTGVDAIAIVVFGTCSRSASSAAGRASPSRSGLRSSSRWGSRWCS